LNISDEELLKLSRRAAFLGIGHEELSKRLEISYEELKQRIAHVREKEYYSKFLEENQGDLYKPELFKVNVYKPLEFQLNNFIAVCDVHVPCTDYDFAMLPAAVAKKNLPEGERILFVHGDVFNQDVFGKWPKVVQAPTWQQEREAAANLFAIWAKTFDKIIVTPGNHDYRILTKLEGQSSFAGILWDMIGEQDQDLNQMFGSLFSTGKLVTSAVDYVFVETRKGRYIIEHGKEYSINPLTVANEDAQKYQSHVIRGHEHHVGLTMDKFNRYWIINNGGLFDKDKFAYVSLQASKRPVMKKGFTMVKSGYPTLFGQWTDWREWI